jgi:hydrogenase maturation protease
MPQEHCWRSGGVAESGRVARQDLVIGIGNSLRKDDGVGWQLARWAQRRWPDLRLIQVQQLTPELSSALVEARRVLFIDAWLPPIRRDVAPMPELQLLAAPLPGSGAVQDGSLFSHGLEPQPLLAITQLLHGRAPRAWQLLVPAFDLGHGDGLSEPLQRLLPQAEDLLRRWRQEACSHA